MLTFAVIPHHHHQEYICFNKVHCETETHTGQPASNESPAHANHGCVKNLFQTQISRIQSLEHSCSEGNCHHFTIVSFLVPDLLALLSLEADNLALPDTVYRERLHSFLYTSDFSGRAPPYCKS